MSFAATAVHARNQTPKHPKKTRKKPQNTKNDTSKAANAEFPEFPENKLPPPITFPFPWNPPKRLISARSVITQEWADLAFTVAEKLAREEEEEKKKRRGR